MLIKAKNNEACWWCGKIANSKEHKIKKTDLTRIYGEGPFEGSKKLGILNIDSEKKNRPKTIQGPKSNYLKFEESLCEDCNTNKSSPFDSAYDIFMNHVDTNEEVLKSTLILDFTHIFGTNWKTLKANLFRYYTKHICCRIAYNEYEIPDNLINFLNQEEDLMDLNFMFQFKNYSWVFDGGSLKLLYIGRIRFHKELFFGTSIAATSYYTYKQFSVNYVYASNVLLSIYESSSNFFDSKKMKIEPIDYSNFIKNIEGHPLEIMDYLEEYPLSPYKTGEYRLNTLCSYNGNLK